jgi:hypothetical protein
MNANQEEFRMSGIGVCRGELAGGSDGMARAGGMAGGWRGIKCKV